MWIEIARGWGLVAVPLMAPALILGIVAGGIYGPDSQATSIAIVVGLLINAVLLWKVGRAMNRRRDRDGHRHEFLFIPVEAWAWFNIAFAAAGTAIVVFVALQ